VDNLRAFAKLYGYVRWFHPSDQAAALDWEAFAAYGAGRVRDAVDADELRRTLGDIFLPVAPTVRIYTSQEIPPPLPEELAPADSDRMEVVAWQHMGVGLGNPDDIYRSVRTNRVPPDGGGGGGVVLDDGVAPGTLFEGHPLPGDVVRKPLGQGLTAQVPLALYSRNGQTLGTPNVFDRQALEEDLAAFDLAALTPGDEALRVADVIIAWNVFQHFYPYWDVVDADWDAVLTEGLDRAIADRDGAGLLATLRWMVSGLQDGHGFVSNPAFERVAFLPARVEWIEERVVVVATGAPDVIRVGDVVATVDGRPAAEVLREGADGYSGSPQWRMWRALGQFGAGPPESEARLELHRAGGTVSATVRRQAEQPPAEARPAVIEEMEPGLFYVDLDRMDIDAFQARAEELAGATGVVFDLRGYPNGNHLALTYLADDTLDSAFWHVPRVTLPDHDGELTYRESRWTLPPSLPRFRGSIVFITDGRAISYAESVMGIVEHYRLGDIVGQPTAGANGNVNPLLLPGGYRISWTGMRVIKHDGSQHHLVGIQPTVPVTRTLEGVRAGRDELLERALELARGG
jgi:hypothetical protein